jgi:hypothetical protein
VDGGSVDDGPSEDGPLDDAELSALALQADPDAPIAEDAVPLSVYLASAPGPLPGWYMPAAIARPGNPWRLAVVVGLVVVFVTIEAMGLCSTYGQSLFH